MATATKPCVITVEPTTDPVGVHGVVKTPDGELLCNTRVFSADQGERAHEHAAWMAEGLGAEVSR